VERHPILPVPPLAEIEFTFDRKKLKARQGEVISSALFAAGIHIFGRHHRAGAPQ